MSPENIHEILSPVEAVKIEMRNRIVKNIGFFSYDDIQYENTLPPEGNYWIREVFTRSENVDETQANQSQLAIAEYDIFVKSSKYSGTTLGSNIQELLIREFRTGSGRIIQPQNMKYVSALAYKHDYGASQADNPWYIMPLLIYLEIKIFEREADNGGA